MAGPYAEAAEVVETTGRSRSSPTREKETLLSIPSRTRSGNATHLRIVARIERRLAWRLVMILRSALFIVLLGLPLAACSSGAGSDDADTASDELGRGQKDVNCTKDECGPGPLVASRICPDKSIAGPVCGRSAKGTCGWTITSCPPAPPPVPSCDDPGACGPALGMPSQVCADGSTAGPTCARSSSGTCGWTITSCP